MMENNIEIYEKYRINPLNELPEPPAYCLINNLPSLTAGNFSLINGKKKAGKTFLLGVLIASIIDNSLQIESIKGCLPEGKNSVLYFDTEQSQYHATRSIKRICELVGNPNPDNLFAYGLRPLSPEKRLEVIEDVVLRTPNVGFVAIDGIRDLLTTGINNEQEATKLTNLFLKWSYDLGIHIVLLLHQNKNDVNARGHIGSEVVNKAETVISVTKEEKCNIFKVSCDDSRDISFDDFYFSISENGLPCASDLKVFKRRAVTDPKLITDEKHFEVLHTIFKDGLEYTYGDLKKELMQEFNIGRDASERYISFYSNDKKWITKEKKGKCTYYRFNVTTSIFSCQAN